AEDGIRDLIVTGVQTCALPICKDGDVVGELSACKAPRRDRAVALEETLAVAVPYSEIVDAIRGTPELSALLIEVFCDSLREAYKIGRASCRERVASCVVS